MLTSITTVVERRTVFSADGATIPFEAGWAAEAVFFVQAEAGHPELRLTVEISPDGLAWTPHSETRVLTTSATLAAVSASHFGTWIRLRIDGASHSQPVTLLVHLTLKG